MGKEHSYNYEHFNPRDYNFKNFKGPKAGAKYIDFEATTLDGKTVKFSDFLDKTIVLDTGSITCPMYANTTGPMNLLKEQFPDVHFLLLYVREAHPGGRTKEITNFAEKMGNAKATSDLYNEKREVLVDTVDGIAHKLYGSMPNMTYVIGKDGIIKFRANWANIDALKKVLLNPDKIESKDYYSVVKPPLRIALRTLLIGGVRALYEFLKGLPQLMKQHKEVESK
ncbi:redoxin domain-containing protein [Tamlana agarivorans]|uniref:Redoxin domain-containing protein n=1 Tax=Pseudotamlana agarivorans TaxID=481183 RepID=A0ACC5UC95_9FLAO|nr:deiodinase-like protein [Tamlana agarivorans]MBU2951941.1 redoxin domain-containing protein [Tamlana agarivorans]